MQHEARVRNLFRESVDAALSWASHGVALLTSHEVAQPLAVQGQGLLELVFIVGNDGLLDDFHTLNSSSSSSSKTRRL